MSCDCGKQLKSKFDIGSICEDCGKLIRVETAIGSTTAHIDCVFKAEQRLYIVIDGKTYDYHTGEEINVYGRVDLSGFAGPSLEN